MLLGLVWILLRLLSSSPLVSGCYPSIPSPSVTSITSSLPSPAPPGFPVASSFRLFAPTIGLHHPVHSLAPSVVPYSFPVSFLLPAGPAASSPFLPSFCTCPCCVFSSRSCCLFFFLSFWLCFFGGYCRLLVLVDDRLLLGSFSLFLGSAYPFSGSACGFVGSCC